MTSARKYKANRLPFETCIIWKLMLSYGLDTVIGGRRRYDEYE